jgi:hypothetical protein
MCYFEIRKLENGGVLVMANPPNKVRERHFGRLSVLFQKLSVLLHRLDFLLF